MVRGKRALQKNKLLVYVVLLLIGLAVFYSTQQHTGKFFSSSTPEKYTGYCRDGSCILPEKGVEVELDCNVASECTSLRCNPSTFSCDIINQKNAPGTKCTAPTKGLSNECGHYGCTGTTCGAMKKAGPDTCDPGKNAANGDNVACYSASCDKSNACKKIAGSGAAFCTGDIDCITACKVNGNFPNNVAQQYTNNQCGPCSDPGCDGVEAGKKCTTCAPGQQFFCVSTSQSCTEGDPKNTYTGLCGLKCVASTVPQKTFDDIVQQSGNPISQIGEGTE